MALPDRHSFQTIRLNVFREDAATAIARGRGFLNAAGIDLKITETPNSTEQMRGLCRGDCDLASTAFDNVLAWSGREGVELIAIAKTRDEVTLPVFARPEITDWSDLRGKKLAVDAVDTAFALVLRRILLANGLDMDKGDYELVAKGNDRRRLESMIQGETFAAIINAPDPKAQALGIKRLGDQRTVLPRYASGVLAAERRWAASHRETLVSFLRAWLKGIRWAQDSANRDEASALVGRELKVDPKVAARNIDALPATGHLDEESLASVLDLRLRFGLKPILGPDLVVYYDRSYLDAAKKD